MRASTQVSKALWVMSSAIALTGCGSSSSNDDAGPGAGAGTVTEEWATYCTGTFTEDTPVTDNAGEPLFTARAGEEYLLSDFSDSFGGRAEFLYLTDVGPDSFEVEANANDAWPFTSNCKVGEGVPYYAAFTDVTIFAEKELKTKACTIDAGSALPATNTARGYSLTGSVGESAVYELILGPFSAQCQSLDRGYISVPQTRSFNSTTWLIPIVGIIGPT